MEIGLFLKIYLKKKKKNERVSLSALERETWQDLLGGGITFYHSKLYLKLYFAS